MTAGNVFRTDPSNVGDWYCAPSRYFPLGNTESLDIIDTDLAALDAHVIVGGGGLVAKTFHPHLERLAQYRPKLSSLIAWGIGESEHVDRSGGFVLPYAGRWPDYLAAFDLVGVRDYGTSLRWVPCASCMMPELDQPAPVTRDIVIYEHKRIPIPIDEGFARRTNNGNDIASVLAFLASAELVITNSYHGAYWATLMGRRVLAIVNMSKMYRFKHSPVICRADQWKRFAGLARSYPMALAECRAASTAFYRDVAALRGQSA